MYDSEEEIKKKRKTLFTIIVVAIVLVALLIIILLIKSAGSKTKKTDTSKSMGCTLEVKNNVKPNSDGSYNQQVEVGFKNIDAISSEYNIVKQTVGLNDSSRNKETFKTTKSGTYKLHGYVQDSAGHKGTCDLTITVNLSKPSCELGVTKGTLGDNEWYRSDVEIGFKDMKSNNQSTSIVKYYIIKVDEAGNPIGDTPTTNVDKLVVSENGSVSLLGYVVDSTGAEGICDITISKDSTVPTCKLKAVSGTPNGSGVYTDTPEIGFDEVKDLDSGVASQGVGISKNYNQKTFKVTDNGKTTVVGYVRDKAGNEGSCSIEITRPSPEPTKPPVVVTNPTCKITGVNQGKYEQDVTLTLTYTASSGTTIVSYGLGETETFNNKNSVVVSNNGSHTFYGVVKDSNGYIGKCYSPTFTIDKGELLSKKVSKGDLVNYDAGTWSETKTVSNQEGSVGGYSNGTSRQTGVKCDRSVDNGTSNGWIVYGVIDGKVILIHAGTPECIFHGRTSTSTVINTMNSEANKYINTKYAESATILSCGKLGFDCNKTSYEGDNVLVTTNHYWIAVNGENNTLYSISTKGTKQNFNLKSYGIRPLVVLKADVKTTGKNNNTWILK